MYITLYERYNGKLFSTIMITAKEWERAGRPANVQEYEVFRLNEDNEVRARFEAERDQTMELEEESAKDI